MHLSGSALLRSLATLIAMIVISSTAQGSGRSTPNKTYIPSAVELAALDGFALGLVEAQLFSGVMLVASDGKIVFEKAYGTVDAEKETPVEPEKAADESENNEASETETPALNDTEGAESSAVSDSEPTDSGQTETAETNNSETAEANENSDSENAGGDGEPGEKTANGSV